MTGQGVEITETSISDLRPALRGLCYRMLGCPFAAEDATQETLARMWRRRDRFDPTRASLRTWAFRIATNVCIDQLRAAPRRALPVDLEGPSAATGDAGRPLANDRLLWPIPTASIAGEELGADVAGTISLRESIRLAFVAALQRLGPVERASLVLRDVYGLSTEEAAECLGRSLTAVESAVARARRKLRRDATHDDSASTSDPDDPYIRALVDRYVTAFEAHDIAAMVALMTADISMSMPPYRWWVQGRDDVRAALQSTDFCQHSRLLTTSVNGSIGLGHYLPIGPDGAYQPWAVIALHIEHQGIASTTSYLDTPELFDVAGLPRTLITAVNRAPPREISDSRTES